MECNCSHPYFNRLKYVSSLTSGEKCISRYKKKVYQRNSTKKLTTKRKKKKSVTGYFHVDLWRKVKALSCVWFYLFFYYFGCGLKYLATFQLCSPSGAVKQKIAQLVLSKLSCALGICEMFFAFYMVTFCYA